MNTIPIELYEMWFQENLTTENPDEIKSVTSKVNKLSAVDTHTMEDQGIDMTLVRKYFQ